MPEPIGRELAEHEVMHADRLGWGRLSNGELLFKAEQAGFDLLLTADQNIRYQQNLTGRRIAVVVVTTNSLVALRQNIQGVRDALDGATAGAYAEVRIPRPMLRRRPKPV